MSRRGPKLNFSDDSSGDETEFGMENMNTEERKHLFTEGSRKCRPLTRNEKFCLVGGLIAVVVVVLLFVLIGAFSLSRGSSAAEPWKDVRLPKSLRPLNYVLNLQVNMETFAVSGNVIIATEVVDSTQYVILHAKDMDIGSHSVKKDDENLNVKSYFFYPENDFYVMELSSQVGDGTLEVELSFNYTLRDDLVGFYKSSYMFSEDTRYLATTQFEPTDARRAFPCFDEPAMKANFTTSIEHACEYTATSNMPISDETKCENNLKTTNFRPSVKMSTYLVAFVVSEFAYKNGTTKTGVEVKVWANPAVIGKTDYALEVAITVLEYYDRYFNVPYPLPKQDLFAIPDFAAGAMENWGLITYRETTLLYEEGKDPATSKQRVAVVIAHELAHQWFGNLVTMAWWDGLWLNEGFASYVEYIGTNESNPDFAMADQFFTDAVLSAFSADGLNESHPIIQVVNDPNEINSLFDSISYDKGASLIRMLKDFLGEEHFLQGLTYYLNRYKFGNAETVDLWNALQETAPQSEVTISALMDTWTKQMGYPVLTVTRDGGGEEITVKQERFFQVGNNSDPAPSPYNYVWKIPFTYFTDKTEVTSMVITKPETRVTLPTGVAWYKANANQMGFYRVNYDDNNWNSIKGILLSSSFSKLSDSDRAGLMQDAFALSSAGLLDTEFALDLSKYLVSEEAYVPWVAAIEWLGTFGSRLSLTRVYGDYKCYVDGLLQPRVDALPFNRTDLDHLDVLLRSLVLRHSGAAEVDAIGRQLFLEWKNNNQTFDPNLKDFVYSRGIALGTTGDWDFMWELYMNSSDPYEKRLFMKALSFSNQPWILARYLEYSITKVRLQDTLSVISYISNNVIGRYLAWNFFRDNYDFLYEKFGGGSFSFARIIRGLTSAFSTELELKEVKDFFSEKPEAGSGTRAYLQTLEVIRGNIDWLNANLNLIEEWLSNN